MSTDDTLTRRIRDEGSRAGAFKLHKLTDRAAEARAKLEYLQALRARVRADAALVAAGVDPRNFDAELAAAIAKSR